MADNDDVLLSDRNIVPTDELVHSIMGENKSVWVDMMSFLANKDGGFSGSWNWYNDGKRWIYKMVFRKKTIFWAVLIDGSFRLTCYFGDKAESIIMSSDLPEELRISFRDGKRYGKIRAITIQVKGRTDLDSIKKLIELKLKIK
ncbi:MAG: DUF3788 family protein [Bacteroidales bacterium]